MSIGSAGALILVDLQRDFLNRPSLEPHPDALVACARRWLESYRASGLPVAHVLTRVTRHSDQRMMHWKKSGLWDCEQGTAGEQPPDCLTPLAGEPVFYKEGYLPPNPGLVSAWAKRLGVERVALSGVMAHACVAYLAAALLSDGLEVGWAAGAVGSDRPQAAAQTLSHLSAKGLCELALDGCAETAFSSKELDMAVAEVQSAWLKSPACWPTTRPVLLAWAALLEDAAMDLACQITSAVGKPLVMARDEVHRAAASIRDVVRWRDAFQSERAAPRGISARRPLGVVAVVTPWNNPLSISAGRLAPALAYGNSVIWKPAPAVESVSRQILGLARQAGLPAERCLLCLGGAETGRRLVWHPGVDAVTFSGSLARGRFVLAACTERLIKCQIEMGGNNAAIVAPDANAAEAAEAVLSGAFAFAGQRCTANRRVILLPGATQDFLDRAHSHLDDWIPSDPLGESCRIGPVKDVVSAERIQAVIERAVAKGARVSRSGQDSVRALGPRYVAPALIEGAGEQSEVVREETFGPVLVVQEARDWDDALRLLNAVPQGLVASLFSRSEALWKQFKDMARAGILRRNSATAGVLEGLPFGGWKASGWGEAEHAEADALFFTRLQAWIQEKEEIS